MFNTEEILSAGRDKEMREHAIAFANYVMNDYKLSLHPDSPILTDEEIYQKFIEKQSIESQNNNTNG